MKRTGRSYSELPLLVSGGPSESDSSESDISETLGEESDGPSESDCSQTLGERLLAEESFVAFGERLLGEPPMLPVLVVTKYLHG